MPIIYGFPHSKALLEFQVLDAMIAAGRTADLLLTELVYAGKC